MSALVWRRTSPYSIAAVGTDYAVSRARVPDPETHALVDRFTAWHGPELLAQPRETARPARILGVRGTAAEAKALCEAHLASTVADPSTPALTLPLAGGRVAKSDRLRLDGDGRGSEPAGTAQV